MLTFKKVLHFYGSVAVSFRPISRMNNGTPLNAGGLSFFFDGVDFHILYHVQKMVDPQIGSSLYMFFPECVARVPVSLWGCGGRALFAGRCVYVRNRPQPFAIVRNRSQPFA